MDSPLYGYECCTFLIFANFEEITNTKTGAYIVNRFKSNKSMIINNNEIVIKPIQEEDIPLFDKWLDKEYIKKWFGEKENWLNEINERNGQYSFLKHFIVYYNDRKIGYCLYADCFYGDVAEQNHTYEIGYLIGEEEFLNRGIGKRIIQILEDKITEIGGKEIAADPAEENIISIKTLLSNGFKKKSDGDYRKICKMR